MLDRYMIPIIKTPLNFTAKICINNDISADKVTWCSFLLGLCALPSLWLEQYTLALTFIILNRIGDGLDGAIARLTSPSDAGGFLDITLDFLFYALIPFGFILANPDQNAVWGALLIISFVGTGSSFLAFASIAAKQKIENPVYRNKSLYYMSGVAEGTETIAIFIAFCIWPQHFPILAAIFALICFFTAGNRIWAGYQTIQQSEVNSFKDTEE
ncbi:MULTISPECIES: CDP-alcohol phosphatidyltransferase family protein [Vibrio]|uniref:CDP-alcohol phosphatidyltransferase family protein n=1 Tax=Vibrio casei TaxID=673372 RepID=A0A368LNF9_9VIBR|nr:MULTISPECIES: CDP-alcohol phosphatidyltransferase family protein [Vibrio]RCS73387.1 CDP-alcohol phosphatidyltransferase family protein [Vibrio casei]SJN17377.1 Putative phosphatidylglycerophosphate synthase [Vibrio casei]HBV75864.1 CDP-alcohol phosphatidyltransferase family protein [Vibrio sp.]